MPRYRAVPVLLSAGERRTLKKRAGGAKTSHRDWLRAQIVLAAAPGRASARIAADLHVSVDTVRKWRGRPARVEHEYQRQGALALLAALDVRTGKVFAATPATTGITPFMDLIGQVMNAEPYASAPRVFVIVDNG